VVLEVVDTSGVAVPNARIYVKGGYKKYTASTDFQYYFDNVSPSDTRVATDAGGLVALSNLVPGDYYICGDTGSTSCVVGGSAYHALAAVPYAGDNAFSPINIPIYDASSPPSTTYEYGGKQYYQKVRVIIAPSGNWPRLTTLTPAEANLSTPTINAFPFQIKGANLPCSSNPASCSTVVRVKQGANTFSASCVGTSAGLTLDCTVNLSTAVAGATYLEVVANGHTLTLPSDMKWAGINVAP
jgi:hypothetical protein